jgi:spore germination protein YaaH
MYTETGESQNLTISSPIHPSDAYLPVLTNLYVSNDRNSYNSLFHQKELAKALFETLFHQYAHFLNILMHLKKVGMSSMKSDASETEHGGISLTSNQLRKNAIAVLL